VRGSVAIKYQIVLSGAPAVMVTSHLEAAGIDTACQMNKPRSKVGCISTVCPWETSASATPWRAASNIRPVRG